MSYLFRSGETIVAAITHQVDERLACRRLISRLYDAFLPGRNFQPLASGFIERGKRLNVDFDRIARFETLTHEIRSFSYELPVRFAVLDRCQE